MKTVILALVFAAAAFSQCGPNATLKPIGGGKQSCVPKSTLIGTDASGNVAIGTTVPGGAAAGSVSISGSYYGDGSNLTGVPATNLSTPFSITATNPTTSNPNLSAPFSFTSSTVSANTNPNFSNEQAFNATQNFNLGQNLYGGGTNAKKTSMAMGLTSNAIGSGQRFVLNTTQNCYGMGDCFKSSDVVTFAGADIAGDEGQGFNSVSYLQQQGSLTKTTINSAITKTTCNTTLTQSVTASKTAQAVTVASTTGCVVNDWVVVDRALPSNTPNVEAVQITAVGGGAITGIFRANHNNATTVEPAVVFTVASASKFGQDRVLVDLSASAYTTGTVASISGGGLTGSGTSWTTNMVGGDANTPGCLAMTADDYTGAPFSGGNGPLKSWYEIIGPVTSTGLGVYSTTTANDAAYHGKGPGSGGYTARPCARVLAISGTQVVLSANTFTWTNGDSVELAISPYPDVTGFQFYSNLYTPGGAGFRNWMLLRNTGARMITAGITFDQNMASGGGADTTGYDTALNIAATTNTGIYVAAANTQAINFAGTGAGGQLSWPNSRYLQAPSTSGLKMDLGTSGTLQFGHTNFATVDPTGLSTARTYTLPNVSGTLITTGDTQTVTNTMLAGSIALTKLNATLSGNTTQVATVTGTLTSGNCASWDVSGNAVDSGAPCVVGPFTQVTKGSLLVVGPGSATADPYFWGSSANTTNGRQYIPASGKIRNPYVITSTSNGNGVVECFNVMTGFPLLNTTLPNIPGGFCIPPAAAAGQYGTGWSSEYWHVPQYGTAFWNQGKNQGGGTAATVQAGSAEFVADTGYVTLLMAGDNGHNPTASATLYWSPIGNYANGPSMTGTDPLAYALPMPFAGTLSNAGLVATTMPTANATLTMEKIASGGSSAADTSVTVTVASTDTAPSYYVDSTHTDTAAAGDAYTWKVVTGASTQFQWAGMSSAFTASSGTHTAVFFLAGGNTVGASARYVAANGLTVSLTNGTVAPQDVVMPFACAATNLYGIVDTQNSGGVTTTITVEQNDADSLLSGTITSSTPVGSVALDTTHTVNFAAGDKIALKVVATNTSGKMGGFAIQCN